MHDGMRRMSGDLRRRYPRVLACGEMHYDGLLEFIPLYQSGGSRLFKDDVQRSRNSPAPEPPGAGPRDRAACTESGFGRFDPRTLSLAPDTIPTLNIVDDTFTKHRDAVMAAVIPAAKERAGIPYEIRMSICRFVPRVHSRVRRIRRRSRPPCSSSFQAGCMSKTSPGACRGRDRHPGAVRRARQRRLGARVHAHQRPRHRGAGTGLRRHHPVHPHAGPQRQGGRHRAQGSTACHST